MSLTTPTPAPLEGVQQPPLPIYRVGNDCVLRTDACDERALKRLFASVQQRLGPHVRVACWPLRHNGAWTVMINLRGDHGGVDISVATGHTTRVPGVRDCDWPLYVNDWIVIDAVDIFYLVAALMAALDLASDAEDWPFLGLKRVISPDRSGRAIA